MSPLSSAKSQVASKFWRKRHYILIFFVATLSSTVVLKIGEIQILELILFVDLFLLLCIFVRNQFRVEVFRPYLSIGASYAIFIGLAFLLAVFALQQNFFQRNDSFFKKPLLLTVARIAELIVDVFYTLYLASLYREDEGLCRFCAKVYYWAGVGGCIYSFITFPLNLLFESQLGTYGESHRLRGFNNEGGSFGLYLVSVCFLAIVMYRRRWLGRAKFYFGMGILFVGFIGSQSKSAISAAVLLGVFHVLWISRGWRRWAAVTGMCLTAILVASFLNFQKQIDAYIQGAAQYQQLSNLRSNDGNIVMGRVAGAVLTPRIIAEHPWLGIGWGNYPLVRDDPQYRRGTAFAINSSDAPGLGFIDYLVELGIPLWLYLTWIELKPAYMLRRHGADIWLVTLAMIQPVTNWFGAHLNLIHPWVVLGLALGMGFRKERRPVGAAASGYSRSVEA
jgi:hypothetical protein